MKYNTLILYQTHSDARTDGDPEKFLENPSVISYGGKAFDALWAFANIPVPHSELIQDDDPMIHARKIEESLINHQDPKWVNKYFEEL